MTNYRCIEDFVSTSGKKFFKGLSISHNEYISLFDEEKVHFLNSYSEGIKVEMKIL